MMSKQDNQNFLKIQTYVLKVNIHCDGCKKTVKKLLQKIDGVYTISIDSVQGKVSVSGSADPSTLIKKLNKAGKHAELLAPKGGSNSNSNNKNNFLSDQLQTLKLDSGKGQQKDNGKPQRGDGGGGGGGGAGGKDQKGQKLSQQIFKDLKLPQLKGLNFPSQKDQKNVKFSLPEDFDDGSDFDDDYENDGFDDYDDDDDFDELDDEDDFDLKPINTKPMSDKKGGGDSRGNIDKKSGGNNGGKKGGAKPKDDKNGKKDNGKNSKKGGEKNEAQPKMMGQGFSEMDMGKMNGPMGGGIPQGVAVQGMPAANPYHQQQYMAMMRQQQQQQQMMMNGPTVYGQPMGYMPAPPVYGEPYANYFSDENTNSSCSIM